MCYKTTMDLPNTHQSDYITALEIIVLSEICKSEKEKACRGGQL